MEKVSIPPTFEAVVDAMNENFKRAEFNIKILVSAIEKLNVEINALKSEIESMKMNMR